MKLRKYQQRIIKAQNDFISNIAVLRATVLAATGAGKTVCFTNLITKIFSNATTYKRILIVHPRLALSSNQQKRLKKDLVGLNVEFTSFHSGEVYHTRNDKKNQKTTSKEKLEEILLTSNSHHITFSSYKSLKKIADMDFDLIICDEAHYLVQSDLRINLHLFKSKVIFYTGTPISVAAQEESMDNIELFGDVIAEVPPSDLIPDGYIVAPRIRYVHVKTKDKGNTIDYPSTIAHAYKDQIQIVNPKFNHKMLVAMPNTTVFSDIMDQLVAIREIVEDFNLDVYYISADHCSVNGTIYGGEQREFILEHFEKNKNRCIIIHCDTLAEGIDIDGIGGILLLRNLAMAKLIQTIGRGCRAAKQDIRSNGEIKKNRIKTNCIVTLVRVNNEWISGAKTSDYAELFELAGYGKLWDIVDPDCKVGTPGGELGETADVVWDEVVDIKITEHKNVVWEELFGEPT
jgi:superfamily II DNA or RNA helicase